MLIFAILALTIGAVNVINLMVNLQAKIALGTANGTLINYLEASVISFLLVLFTGEIKLTNLLYLKSIPTVYFLGGIFGLISMVLVLHGLAISRISYATVVVLIGQLGAGFLIDTFISGKIIPLKIIGISMVVIGVFLDKFLINSQREDSTSLGSP
ncbi:hypothetical protein Desaci_2743 [Desulfosporosinus acidiphilus SJ4]|uniref:EamA-like transporter family n=1 Tax=Desulfosporosinus acidiphilus (strain DSM 22704 / JCM 16185 / SJ4) TaxID=646529 RepID=I4D797_DESAJ|nr:DMT family transporter [Desulfosporosinus acidiphilus]AFM41671.1 hypothetical protein Desaci_2743 [Desulfosporosinus acidiphilus SJ4]